MDQNERRVKLIQDLLAERPEYRETGIPDSIVEQKRMLRSLFNVRMPGKISDDFLDKKCGRKIKSIRILSQRDRR